jgi:hypothetical protein
MSTISLKTVYQTINELASLGEVVLIDLGTGSERIDQNVERDHQHLVCQRCGTVRDLQVDTASLALNGALPRGFLMQAVQVIARGTCGACAANEAHVLEGDVPWARLEGSRTRTNLQELLASTSGAIEDRNPSAEGRPVELRDDLYPGFARIARDEGFYDIAEWFETLARAEGRMG